MRFIGRASEGGSSARAGPGGRSRKRPRGASGVAGEPAAGRKDTADTFLPRRAPYIPLIDWVTMHRLISYRHFGPEWGGHQLWGADDDDDTINEKREAIEQFIINVNGLDKLAKLIAERLDIKRKVESGTTFVDPASLLDPINRLFNSGEISEKECEDLFGYKVGSDGDDETGYTSDDNFPWVRLSDSGQRKERVGSAGDKVMKNFFRWAKGTHTFYPIGLRDGVDPDTGEPSAYIRMMNTVFPSNKIGKGKDASPRERIDRVRDSSAPDILREEELYAHLIFRGDKEKLDYYPVPNDEEGVQEYL